MTYRTYTTHGTYRRDRRGTALLLVLIFGSVAATVIVSGVASYAMIENRASNHVYRRDLGFQIAEAGVNYYRWHLAHDSTDYTDGTMKPGPYQHEYRDKDGNLVGYFSLEIIPPLPGSTVLAIRSTGWTIWQPESQRTLQVRLGFPSLADYTFLSNARMAFGATTQVHGTVHSNSGIRFDGTTDSWVRSATTQYQYLNPFTGLYEWHPGVWGAGGPVNFWQFPVPSIDFFAVTADLANIRTMADNGGLHLTSSGQQGWHIRFTSSTFHVYKVSSVNCYSGYCYDIRTEDSTYHQVYAIPANGAIFAEDNVWVDGTVDGRVVLGVGRFPVQQPYRKVIIPANLVYRARGSNDTIGIIAQGNIITPYGVPTDMEINGALLSQFGTIYRPNYSGNTKNSLTVFGSQITYVAGGWKYVNAQGQVVSGFINTNHVFDGNLRYYPPPGFPVGNTYDLISWEEVG